jgi:hypothetical protein
LHYGHDIEHPTQRYDFDSFCALQEDAHANQHSGRYPDPNESNRFFFGVSICHHFGKYIEHKIELKTILTFINFHSTNFQSTFILNAFRTSTAGKTQILIELN